MAINVEDIPEEDEDFTAREYSVSEFAQMLDDESMPTDEEMMDILMEGMQFEEDDDEEYEDIIPGTSKSEDTEENDSEDEPDAKSKTQEETLLPYDPETGEILEEDEAATTEDQDPVTTKEHQEADAPATEGELPASQKQPAEGQSQNESGQQPPESAQDPSGTPTAIDDPDALQSLLDQAASLLNKAEDLQQRIAAQSEQLTELTSTLESIKSLEDQNAAQIEASAKDVEKSTIGLKVMLRNTEKKFDAVNVKFDESGKNIEAAEKKFNRQITDMTKNAKSSIGELANAARDHIQKLEQESMKRSQAYFQLNLPQKILNYMKWFGCIVVFVLAVAWILERVVG